MGLAPCAWLAPPPSGRLRKEEKSWELEKLKRRLDVEGLGAAGADGGTAAAGGLRAQLGRKEGGAQAALARCGVDRQGARHQGAS